MEVVAHADAGEFARLARPLLEPDPVRHTSVLRVLHGALRGAFFPVTMLTLHEGDAVVGALLRTDGRPALVSGVPTRCAAAVVDALPAHDPEPGRARGPPAAAGPGAGRRAGPRRGGGGGRRGVDRTHRGGDRGGDADAAVRA